MFKKDKPYTDKQKAFLLAMSNPENKGSIRACMDIAGYSSDTAQSQVTSALKEEIVEAAKQLLASHSVRATIGIIDVLNSPTTPGASVVINAAKEILDRANVAEKTEDVKVKVGSGIVILPAKGSAEAFSGKGASEVVVENKTEEE